MIYVMILAGGVEPNTTTEAMKLRAPWKMCVHIVWRHPKLHCTRRPEVSHCTFWHKLTLWHKIITLEKSFWNSYFRTIDESHGYYFLKCLPFLDISRAQSPSKITKNNSQGIIFVIISCQRVLLKKNILRCFVVFRLLRIWRGLWGTNCYIHCGLF